MNASLLALAKSIYQLRNKGNEEQTYSCRLKEYEPEFYFDQQHTKTSFSLNEMPCRMRSENNTLVLSTCFQTCYCGELKQQRRRRHRERQKSDRFRLAKQQLWACITPFLYISLQSLHDCDVKLSNFTLLENVSTRKRLSSFFPELRL